jgi:hypothetical protein
MELRKVRQAKTDTIQAGSITHDVFPGYTDTIVVPLPEATASMKILVPVAH